MLTIRSDNTIIDYAVTENIYKAKSMPRIQFINTSKCTLNLPLIVLLVLSTLHIRFTLYDFWILYTMLSKRIYPAREYLTRQHFSSVIISHKWLHYSHTKENFVFWNSCVSCQVVSGHWQGYLCQSHMWFVSALWPADHSKKRPRPWFLQVSPENSRQNHPQRKRQYQSVNDPLTNQHVFVEQGPQHGNFEPWRGDVN